MGLSTHFCFATLTEINVSAYDRQLLSSKILANELRSNVKLHVCGIDDRLNRV